MFELNNLKTFAKNHPVLTIVGAGFYGIVLGLCIAHDLYYYNIIKK